MCSDVVVIEGNMFRRIWLTRSRVQTRFGRALRFGLIATIIIDSIWCENLRKDNGSIVWSTPEECRRKCVDDQAPLYCYYHFTLEYYTTMNRACSLCRPNDDNPLSNVPECPCVQADGFERTVLSINRMIPGPSIQVCLGDKIVIDVENEIEGILVGLHWHGIFQKGSQYYDGVPYLTQCPIMSRNTFRYQFAAENAGTHFYHSHVAVYKMDGQYGSLIVRAPPSLEPHQDLYDEDLPTHVILLSDWMHEMSIERYPGLLTRLTGQAAINALINGKGTWTDPLTRLKTNVSLQTFDVEFPKRYRFRMINAFSSICLSQFSIEKHRMMIIAQDGEDVVPHWVDTIITGSGERVDFIIDTSRYDNAPTSYWMQLRGLSECKITMVNQLAILRYKGGYPVPSTPEPTYYNGLPHGIVYNPLDAKCDPDEDGLDGDRRETPGQRDVCPSQLKSWRTIQPELLALEPDYQFFLPFKFYSYRNIPESLFEPGSYKSFLTSPSQDLLLSLIDDIAYKTPTSPLITRGMSNGVNETTCDSRTKPINCTTPCVCSHTIDVKKGSIVELVLYDQNLQALIAHPFHLHGYSFHVFSMGRFEKNVNITKQDMEFIVAKHQKRLRSGYYKRVPAKDTIIVPQGGWVILRFKADNPGWWFFHCHFAWHTANGMSLVFHVGEPSDLPPIPPGFPTCGNFQPSTFPDRPHVDPI